VLFVYFDAIDVLERPRVQKLGMRLLSRPA